MKDQLDADKRSETKDNNRLRGELRADSGVETAVWRRSETRDTLAKRVAGRSSVASGKSFIDTKLCFVLSPVST